MNEMKSLRAQIVCLAENCVPDTRTLDMGERRGGEGTAYHLNLPGFR